MSTLCDMGEGRFAHASGALWLPEARAALVADAHLGYGWAQRRRGELGPVEDSKTQPRLRSVMEELRPAKVVFLGDLVHAPKPAEGERAAIEATLREVAGQAELVLVRGNHDRAFGRDFGNLGVEVVESWREGGLTALHGDRLGRMAIPEGHLVVGHLHPVLRVRDAAGGRQKLRLFLLGGGVTVMPAFSPFSGGFDVAGGIPEELRALMGRGAVEGIAVTGTSVMRVGPIGALVRRQ